MVLDKLGHVFVTKMLRALAMFLGFTFYINNTKLSFAFML